MGERGLLCSIAMPPVMISSRVFDDVTKGQ